MNKKELIERIEGLKNIFGNECEYVKIDFVIELASELDELEAGRADEAPRYVKNILARLRELPLHDREVWLKTIMGEFEQDFSRAKWREGYEQGKVEGLIEREKVTVPQFVADWIEKIKKELSLREAMSQGYAPHEVDSWLREMDQDGACLNQELFARAWFEGYEVETEKRYTVKVKGNLGQYLGKYYLNNVELTPQFIRVQNSEPSIFTKEELEQTGFGWVFDCPGIEIEEVEE